MSNAYKNSLLIIVATIICITAPIFGSKVFASELRFTTETKVAYHAPSLDEALSSPQEVDKKIIDPVSGREVSKAEMYAIIEKQITIIEQQIKQLQQQIEALEESNGKGETTFNPTTSEKLVDMRYKTCGPRVKKLQQFLNRNGFTLATDGFGAKGQETQFFGPLTKNAVERLQETYGLPATGVVDKSTRKLINSIEYGVLSKKKGTHCKIQKSNKVASKESKEKKNEQIDGKDTSENFFIKMFRRFFNFFYNLLPKATNPATITQ